MKDVPEGFVPVQHAKMLKECGFDKPCYGRFHHYPPDEMEVRYNAMDWNNNDFSDTMSAPTYQDAENWLWSEHKLYVRTQPRSDRQYIWHRTYRGVESFPMEGFNSPIPAHREGIRKAIEHIHSQLKIIE